MYSIPIDEFERILTTIQDFVAVEWLSHADSSRKTLYKNVAPVVQFLKLLFDANKERSTENSIRISEFYNQVVNENLNCKADYITYKRGESQDFSFIKYPFMLNPELKSEFLQIENNVLMRYEFERVLVSQYFGAPEADPYLILEVNRDSIIADTITQVRDYFSWQIVALTFIQDPTKRCVRVEKGAESKIHS